MNAQKRNRAFGLYLVVIAALALLWILRDNSSRFGQNSLYTYAQFEQDLKSENVVSVVISCNLMILGIMWCVRCRKKTG